MYQFFTSLYAYDVGGALGGIIEHPACGSDDEQTAEKIYRMFPSEGLYRRPEPGQDFIQAGFYLLLESPEIHQHPGSLPEEFLAPL